MLDIAFIRNNPEVVKEGIRIKRMNVDIDELLAVDEDVRKLRSAVEQIRADRNRLSKQIPALKEQEKDQAVEQVKQLKQALGEKEPELRRVEERLEQLMLLVPTPPAPEVPEGDSDDDNVEVRTFGAPPQFEFKARDHLELLVREGRLAKRKGRRSKLSSISSTWIRRLGKLLLRRVRRPWLRRTSSPSRESVKPWKSATALATERAAATA